MLRSVASHLDLSLKTMECDKEKNEDDNSCETGVKRHPVYYFEDGNVIFLVEETLFKIHRFFFVRDSVIFRSMFTLPPGEGKVVEGLTDDHPITLMGVKALDFERLLWVFYPVEFGEYLASVNEWCSILQLAHQWEFDAVRRLAVAKLNALPPKDIDAVDRIVLAHRFQLVDWLLAPYVEISVRPEPITLEEGRKLGIDVVVLLAQAREEVKKKEGATDRHNDIYFGSFGSVPLEKRQSVWNLVAGVFSLPTVQLGPGGKVN